MKGLILSIEVLGGGVGNLRELTKEMEKYE